MWRGLENTLSLRMDVELELELGQMSIWMEVALMGGVSDKGYTNE